MLRLLGYLMLIPILILWIIFRRLRHALHTVCRLLRHVLLRNNGILQTCAEGGKAPAQHALGIKYARGIGLARDERQDAVWWRKAAEQGDGPAQGHLALAYEQGCGVPQDDEQAVFWHGKAAEQGFAPSQVSLGLRCEQGRGGERPLFEIKCS